MAEAGPNTTLVLVICEQHHDKGVVERRGAAPTGVKVSPRFAAIHGDGLEVKNYANNNKWQQRLDAPFHDESKEQSINGKHKIETGCIKDSKNCNNTKGKYSYVNVQTDMDEKNNSNVQKWTKVRTRYN